MPRLPSRALPLAALCLLLMACVGYEPQALDPTAILRVEDDDRRVPVAHDDGLRLVDLEARMLTSGPSLREARAAFRRAEARASIAEPWPEPMIEFGPVLGSGRDVTRKALVPFGSLGLSIPLGDRLEARDQLDRLHADAARVEFEARLRESRMELRGAVEELVLLEERAGLAARILDDASRSLAVANRLVEAGGGTAVDVALFQLEEGRARLELAEARGRAGLARARVAKLIGVAPSAFTPPGREAIPSGRAAPPEREGLIALLIAANPELARRRAAYDEVEAELRLAVAEQYPDLQIGFSGSDEVSEDKQLFGLTLGIELPLFGKQRKEIAAAAAGREEARERFHAAANASLGAIDEALLRLEIATARLDLIESELLPRSKANRERARQALAAGSADALRVLETERQDRRLGLERLEAELGWRAAWNEVETVLGQPIRVFPGDRTEATETPSPEIER